MLLYRTLKSVSGSIVEVFCDENATFIGLYYQDRLMRKVYVSFPELLMCDATYKMNDMRMPLFIMLGVDGNGHSQVVAVYLTTTETASTLSRMLEV